MARWRPAVAAALVLAGCAGQNAEPTLTPARSAAAQPTRVTTVEADKTVGPGGTADQGGASRLFDYDATMPLDVQMAPTPRQIGDVSVYELTYASPAGGRVPALLVLPDGSGPFAGLIIQHGLPGERGDLLGEAVDFAGLGVVSVLIDAPHARSERLGPGTEPINLTLQDRAEQIQLILDLRRAVDLLRARPEVDDGRIGYVGVSYGGAMGGLLAGVEDRIAAYALVVGDGGLVSHFTGPEDIGGPLDSLASEERDAWLAAMEPIEPINFVGQATSPVLFQSGRTDDVVPSADAAEYHAAGNAHSSVEWYDAGHGLNAAARCDRAVWLGRLLGFEGSNAPAC